MDFSEIVKETRKSLELTREEFCCLLGITPSTLYRWESKVIIPMPIYQTIVVYLFLRFSTIKREIRCDKYKILQKKFTQRDKDEFFRRQIMNPSTCFDIPVLDLILKAERQKDKELSQ